jgi:tryptophan halogenase
MSATAEFWTVDRVIVLGGGSAGFMAAIALKRKLPGLSVRVVRSKEIGVIGVGEGSTPPMTRFLHDYIQVGEKMFFETARPSWKLGLKFIWGERPWFHYPFGPHLEMVPNGLTRPAGFYAWAGEMSDENAVSAMMGQDRAIPRAANGGPVLDKSVLAYHFENERLVTFLEEFATALGVETVDDSVVEVRRDQNRVTGLLLKSGREESADLYVDCSGFASLLLGKTLGEPFVSFKKSLICERAVVGGWERGADEIIKPYTTCETMDAGWCWQIEHENRINRGYVYSPDFISDQEAEAEFRRKNPKVGPTRVVRFVSGRYERAWVGNVVAIGNAAGFVEPLEASSLGVICARCILLTNILLNCRQEVRPTQAALFNRDNAENWDSIRDFLAIHYKYNRRVDTPFWRHCREHTELAGARRIVEYYEENGPDPFWAGAMFGPYEAFGVAAYLALLVGMRVPYRGSGGLGEAEMKVWDARRRANREAAGRAMGVKEAMNIIRSPQWRWA